MSKTISIGHVRVRLYAGVSFDVDSVTGGAAFTVQSRTRNASASLGFWPIFSGVDVFWGIKGVSP